MEGAPFLEHEEMIERHAGGPATNGAGAIVGAFIIVGIVAFGGLYFWGTVAAHQAAAHAAASRQ